MTSVGSLINRIVKPYQLGDSQEVLVGDISSTDDQLEVTFSHRVGVGTVLEIGLELIYVVEYDAVNKIATVERGILDTIPVAHTTSEPIYVSPRVPRSDILGYINDCLIDMFPEVFAVGTVSLGYNPAHIGYGIPAEVHDILAIHGEMGASNNSWDAIYDWTLLPGMDTSIFPTGKAVMIRVSMPHAARIQISYTKPFNALSSETQDLEADGGLYPYMINLPFYFTMSRLLAIEETERSQSMHAQNHQRAQDVPGFLALRTGEWYWARYLDLKKSIYQRQVKEFKRLRAGSYGG